MTLNLCMFLTVLLGTLFIAGMAVLVARGIWQRLLLTGFFFGLWVYSGVGAAYSGVSNYYLAYYFGFLMAFACAFGLFSVALPRVGAHRPLARGLGGIAGGFGWSLVIWVYVLLYLVPLVYPEVRLHQLLTPPAPDLLARLATHWQPQEMDTLMRLVGYAEVLLTPFFYIALFRFRRRIYCVAGVLALLVYIQYVAAGYISRGYILMPLAMLAIVLWVTQPSRRLALAIGTAALLPLVMTFSYSYALIRISGTPDELNPAQAAVRVLRDETSFPKNVGMPIIQAGERVNLGGYFVWILTLPIPKLLTGEIEGARINEEISESMSGLRPGEKGFYIVLPGLVAESVYIYGRYFFWLHAVFIAFLGALIIRLVERSRQLLFLQAYVVVQFAYVLNRGGIAGPLGTFVNEFMLFYAYIFLRGVVGPMLQQGERRRELGSPTLDTVRREGHT